MNIILFFLYILYIIYISIYKINTSFKFCQLKLDFEGVLSKLSTKILIANATAVSSTSVSDWLINNTRSFSIISSKEAW